MTILLGAGDGTFRQAWSQLVPGKAPTRVAIGDVNGDQIVDAVFANYGNNSVTVVPGSRNGFNPSTGWTAAVGKFPTGVAIGDLNGDGRGDIVTSNSDDNDISILLTR
jgi:VCBS repeat protein